MMCVCLCLLQLCVLSITRVTKPFLSCTRIISFYILSKAQVTTSSDVIIQPIYVSLLNTSLLSQQNGLGCKPHTSLYCRCVNFITMFSFAVKLIVNYKLNFAHKSEKLNASPGSNLRPFLERRQVKSNYETAKDMCFHVYVLFTVQRMTTV